MDYREEKLTEASLDIAARALASRDRDLAIIYEALGPPPLWARRPGFATLVHIILEQQVSLQSAASTFARLKRNTSPFRPARVTELGEAHLRSLGLTRQKTAYCLHLAEFVTDRRLRLASLASMGDDEARSALMAVKGIGSWSADIYLLMALGRPDVWPRGDLALAVAIQGLKRLKHRPDDEQLLRIAESWRPFRSVAARMLWHYYLECRREAREARAK